MRLFFSKKELKLKRKRTIAAVVCIILLLGIYWVLTRPRKAEPEIPTVMVEAAAKDDVEIYGEYVGPYPCPTVCRGTCPGRRVSGTDAFCRRYLRK